MSTSLSDLPLSMDVLEEEMNRHYSSSYDQKISTYYDELSTVWESMYKKGLRKQLSCYYTHQPLEQDVESPSRHKEDERPAKGGKDLARVHHERALDAGRLTKYQVHISCLCNVISCQQAYGLCTEYKIVAH
ncbi:hypothetical protein QZH41_000095 [Actinostola sp. cb2023]|nr:hypothetical protein QZH41_000095 [Actinostola sp. cb2023]